MTRNVALGAPILTVDGTAVTIRIDGNAIVFESGDRAFRLDRDGLRSLVAAARQADELWDSRGMDDQEDEEIGQD